MATAFMKDTDFLKGCQSFVGVSKYVSGGYGQPLTTSFLKGKEKKKWFKDKNVIDPSKTNWEYLMQFADQGWYCTDCVCLLKGVLWGFRGTGQQGVYGSNGVKDSTDQEFYDMCYNKMDITGTSNTNRKKLKPGMILHMNGHVGTVLSNIGGEIKVIESSPSLDGTKITSINYQPWTGAGYSPYIIYTQDINPSPAPAPVKPITAGSIVKIVEGATYGGSAYGTPVPKEYTGKPYTVTKVETHNNESEALIKELNSWVPTKYLVLVDPNKIEVGSTVVIVEGAVYGGSSYGVKVPSGCIGVPYTVTKIEKHNNEDEALLKEINSWVGLQYLRVYVASSKTYPTKVVRVGDLNVRSGPGTYFAKIDQIHKGAKVTVYETKNDWARIGDKKWVYAPYLK